MLENKRVFYIRVKELQIDTKVSVKTFYHFFNNEKGICIDKNIYEVDLPTIKKHPRIFNRIRRETT